jgi:hypothetical protein
MAKRRPNEADDTAPPETQEAIPAHEPSASNESQEPEGPKKSKWLPRFGSFGDYQAGVRLIEDRENRRMTIKFAEKPSDAVRALLKSEEYGYRFDSEDQVWYKFINPAKPRQSRADADELVLKVADMLREEKGLPPNKDQSVTM